MGRSTGSLIARLKAALVRMWLAFSITAFVVAAAMSVLGRDNPLESDDPYCIGGIAAVFCAGFAFILGVTGAFGRSPTTQRLAYFGAVLSLSVLLVAADAAFSPAEGQGIPTFFGVLIGVTGAAAYPLLRIPLTKAFVRCASIPGVLYLLGYACAGIVMNARRF